MQSRTKAVLWTSVAIITGGLIYMFRCPHKHYSRVFTKVKGAEHRQYVCCFDCGKDIPYDWDNMGKVEPIRVDPHFVENPNVADSSSDDTSRRTRGRRWSDRLTFSPETKTP